MICDNGEEACVCVSSLRVKKLFRLLASSVSFGPDAEPVTGKHSASMERHADVCVWDRLHTMAVNSGLIMFFLNLLFL